MYKIMFIGDKVKVFVNKNSSFTIPYNQYKYNISLNIYRKI